MTDPFTSDFFAANRERLQQTLDSQLIVLAAHGLLQRSADTTFPFRQDSNFWYLTGLEEPDYVLVINGTSTFLIEPRRAEHRDQWDGAVDKRQLKARSGIKEIEEFHDGWLRLDKLLKKYKKVHTIAPAEAYYEHFGFYANPARAALLEALGKHRKLEIVDIRKNLARQRQVKQAEELKALNGAIKITADTLAKIQRKLSSYRTERELMADITREFIRRGAAGHAYQPIIAGGRRAATIHYINNDQPLAADEFVLIDAGAELHNYSADITRTYVLSPPTRRQRAVYEAVLRVHTAAIALLKPGVKMREYEKQVDHIMAQELKRLKLLDDAGDKQKLKKYYPHLASHFLGLDTHDAADYDMPLSVGMVLTVEPGIYIPEEDIGVRIEDDILITADGAQILSDNLPRTLL